MIISYSIGEVPLTEEEEALIYAEEEDTLEIIEEFSFPDHQGRPGEVGGSLPREDEGDQADGKFDEIFDEIAGRKIPTSRESWSHSSGWNDKPNKGIRKKTPTVGYHITDLENLEGIKKHGLLAMETRLGDSPAVAFVDGLYEKGHDDAMESLGKGSIVLRVSIPKGYDAYDDAEVREFTGVGGDENSHLGPGTAFFIRSHISPNLIDVVIPGTRKRVPLLKHDMQLAMEVSIDHNVIVDGKYFSRAARQVDFQAIKRIYDKDALVVARKVKAALREARATFLQTLDNQIANLTPHAVAQLRVNAGYAAEEILRGYLLDTWRKGRDLAIKELPLKVRRGLELLKWYDSDFEEKHPRDEEGQFAPGGEGQNTGNLPTSNAETADWIKARSKDYPSRQEFLRSEEYKKAYPYLVELYKAEKLKTVEAAKQAMAEVKANFGDRVRYDYVTPFAVEEYTGVITDRAGIPYIKLDKGQAAVNGAKSVRWHKGWKKFQDEFSFSGHQGRPGQVGGSLPREGSGGGGGGAVRTKPLQVYMTPADIEPYESWGKEKLWRLKGSAILIKPPVSVDSLPETLYHVTTRMDAVTNSGYLLGQSDGGGMGGGNGWPGVSFTTVEADAGLMVRELRRTVELQRTKISSIEDFDRAISKYVEEDIKTLGDRPGAREAIEKAKSFALESFDANESFYKDRNELSTLAAEEYRNPYLQMRSSATADFYGGYFEANKTNPLRNPLLMGGNEAYKKIDPSQISIVQVSKSRLPKEALVREGSDDFLHEIRVHADVALRGDITHKFCRADGIGYYQTGFEPTQALDYFATRALIVKGLIDDDLTRLAKMELLEHLKGGRSNIETMGNLRALFEPWVGDPEVIEESGLSGASEDLLKAYRLENIVRTETTTALNQGRLAVADAAEDYVVGFEFSAILDERTTEVCTHADGLLIRKDSAAAVKLSPPLHYQCFLNGRVKVYTTEGWKYIRDIDIGDQVLTHRGRFKAVTYVHHKQSPRKYNGDTVRVVFSRPLTAPYKEHAREIKLTVTPDHPFLTSKGWVVARELTPGHRLMVMATPCLGCGKPIPCCSTEPKYCSQKCNSKLSVKAASDTWQDPIVRARRSKQVSDTLRYQYDVGIRNGKEITAAAHEKIRMLIKAGKFHAQTAEHKAKLLKSRLESKKFWWAITEGRRGENNPVHRQTLETKRRYKAKMRAYRKNNPEKIFNLAQYVLDHPEKHVNRLLANEVASKPQRLLFERVRTLDKSAELNFPVKVKKVGRGQLRFVDVALPGHKIALEYDGSYWHKNVRGDRQRDKQLRLEGWIVLRYKDRVPDLKELGQTLNRVCMNHRAEYSFVELPLVRIEPGKVRYRPKRLYNIAVADDESYIVKGAVVHNCRSLLIFVTTDELPVEWSTEEEINAALELVPQGFK